MTASYLPTILVPLVGLVFPAIAMASIFVYIEKQEIEHSGVIEQKVTQIRVKKRDE